MLVHTIVFSLIITIDHILFHCLTFSYGIDGAELNWFQLYVDSHMPYIHSSRSTQTASTHLLMLLIFNCGCLCASMKSWYGCAAIVCSSILPRQKSSGARLVNCNIRFPDIISDRRQLKYITSTISMCNHGIIDSDISKGQMLHFDRSAA